MGADLYLESKHKACYDKYHALFMEAAAARDKPGITEKEKAEAQEKVSKYYNAMYSEGYFRDSYNSSSLLWQLDLSWWSDIIPLVNKKGYMAPTKMKKFKQMLLEKDISLDLGKEAKGKDWTFDNVSEKELKEWYDYFVEKKQELIDFIDTAIALKEPIRCSL